MSTMVATKANTACESLVRIHFTQWVETYGQELYRLALRLVRQPHLA